MSEHITKIEQGDNMSLLVGKYWTARFGFTDEKPVMPEKTKCQKSLLADIANLETDFIVFGKNKDSGLTPEQVDACLMFLRCIKQTME